VAHLVAIPVVMDSGHRRRHKVKVAVVVVHRGLPARAAPVAMLVLVREAAVGVVESRAALAALAATD
jgi:hypothetical protein